MASKKSGSSDRGPRTEGEERESEAPQSAEDIRAAEERVVHEEEMSASVGDVLAHEHAEEAGRLHVVKEQMPETAEAAAREAAQREASQREASQREAAGSAGREEPRQASSQGPRSETPRSTAPRGRNARGRRERRGKRDEEGRAASPHAREGEAEEKIRWRKLMSPFFLVSATRQAVHELGSGVRRARRDLTDALQRARHAFMA